VLCCFVFVPGVVSIQGVEVSAGETGYPLGFPDNTIDGDGGADLPASIGYVGEVPRKGAGPGGHPPGGWTEGSATDTKGRRWWTIIAERRRGPGKRGGGE